MNKLTKVEMMIFSLTSTGKGPKEIASCLSLKRKWVKKIISRIRIKTGIEGCFVKAKRQQDREITALGFTMEDLAGPCDSKIYEPPLRGGSQHMTLPLTRNEFTIHQKFEELTERVTRRSEEFRLSLIGPGNILPDTALAIFHLLKQRPRGVRLIVEAHSSLINSDVLVWLAGDERRIREGAWVLFERSPHQDKGRSPFRKPRPDNALNNGFITDYASVFRLITKHLPVEHAGRRMFPAELCEWMIDVELSNDMNPAGGSAHTKSNFVTNNQSGIPNVTEV